MFWVPGATAGIYGIRNAGLAVSTGTWSAIIVMSSFCWGIIIFEEKVKSVTGTYFATLVSSEFVDKFLNLLLLCH